MKKSDFSFLVRKSNNAGESIDVKYILVKFRGDRCTYTMNLACQRNIRDDGTITDYYAMRLSDYIRFADFEAYLPALKFINDSMLKFSYKVFKEYGVNIDCELQRLEKCFKGKLKYENNFNTFDKFYND